MSLHEYKARIEADCNQMLKAGVRYKVIDNSLAKAQYDVKYAVALDPRDKDLHGGELEVVRVGLFWDKKYADDCCQWLNAKAEGYFVSGSHHVPTVEFQKSEPLMVARRKERKKNKEFRNE
jgi:hypothetical protein